MTVANQILTRPSLVLRVSVDCTPLNSHYANVRQVVSENLESL